MKTTQYQVHLIWFERCERPRSDQTMCNENRSSRFFCFNTLNQIKKGKKACTCNQSFFFIFTVFFFLAKMRCFLLAFSNFICVYTTRRNPITRRYYQERRRRFFFWQFDTFYHIGSLSSICFYEKHSWYIECVCVLCRDKNLKKPADV